MSASWFQSWFDTTYYHQLYNHRDDFEAQLFIKNFVSHIKLPIGSRCWDMCCGKGRHSIYLNKLKYDVVGTDLSPESIAHAKQFEKDKLSFYIHDMRRTFRSNYFDLTASLFTSFGYFESKREDKQVLQNAYDSLRPDGYFIFDFFNATKVKLGLPHEGQKEVDGIKFSWTKQEINGFVVKNIKVVDGAKQFDFKEQVRLIEKAELHEMLAQIGFKELEFFGNYQLEKFEDESSDRLIIIGKK